MIRQLSNDCPVSLLCEVLDVLCSTVYSEPQVKPEDTHFLAAIEDILMRCPVCGYRRVTAQLMAQCHALTLSDCTVASAGVRCAGRS